MVGRNLVTARAVVRAGDLMPDETCRLAQAEANIKNLCEKYEDHCEAEERHLKRIWDSIEDLKELQRNQQGFVRGVVFTISAVAGTVGVIVHYLTGNGGS